MISAAALERAVHDTLDKALANGYDFAGWTDLAVAEDIARYDSDFEDQEPAAIAPHVGTWGHRVK